MGFNNLKLVPANIDEKTIGDRASGDPAELVLEVGRAKSAAAQSSLGNAIPESYQYLLAGDQVVWCDGKILEKPRDEAEARLFIDCYGRLPCRTVGSAVLTDLATGRTVEGVSTADVHFTPFTDEAVNALMAEGGCLQCAGGLMIEHPLVQPFIDRIDGEGTEGYLKACDNRKFTRSR